MKQGGHDVTTADVLRGSEARVAQLAQETAYRPLADVWAVYNNSGRAPELLETGP